MDKMHRRFLLISLILLDVAAMSIALLVAYQIVANLGDPHSEPASGFLPLLVAIPMAVGFFAVNRLYVLDEVLEGSVEYGRILYGCTLAAFGLILLGFWGKILGDVAPSRKLVALIWIASICLEVGGRFLARRIVRALRRRGHLHSRALIVGLGTPGISLGRHFLHTKHAGIDIVGYLDDFLPPGTPVTNGLKVLGRPSALRRILEQTHATEVIVVPTALAWESLQDLLRTATSLNGHAIRLAPGFTDVLATSIKIHQRGFMPLLLVERVRITGLDAALKRMMDYAIAVFSLPIAFPLIVVCSSALAIAGVRPFQSMRVIGREGFPFRTFILNASAPRNRIQRLIYKLGFDKLPQLLNVLLGQMSIVGPRPVPVEHQAAYGRWFSSLVTVKPGLTGTWSMHGIPASLDEEMQKELFYIRNYTIWLDLEIVVRSGIRVLFGRRARNEDEVVSNQLRITAHR